MVVHLGVVVVAVAFAASSSYSTGDEFRLAEGQSATIGGHEITFLGMTTEREGAKTVTRAQVRIDGGSVYEPALSLFPNATQAIATPSVKWGFDRDVFLVLRTAPTEQGGEAVIGVRLEPLVSWLWIGGGIMAIGTVLAAAPGRRRRPTDPVSQALPDDEPSIERREPVGVA